MVDCAKDRPLLSINTTAKSLLSLVTVEKEVLCKVAPASSTIEIKRDHKMLKVMASYFLRLNSIIYCLMLFSFQFNQYVLELVYDYCAIRTDYTGTFHFFNDSRSVKTVSWLE